MEEETRLFYVAMTRAKDRLVLMVSDEISQKNSKVSRFVEMSRRPAAKENIKPAPQPRSSEAFPQLSGGERVRHPLFGEGTVLSVSDKRIEVRFGEEIRQLDMDMCVKMRLLTLCR